MMGRVRSQCQGEIISAKDFYEATFFFLRLAVVVWVEFLRHVAWSMVLTIGTKNKFAVRKTCGFKRCLVKGLRIYHIFISYEAILFTDFFILWFYSVDQTFNEYFSLLHIKLYYFQQSSSSSRYKIFPEQYYFICQFHWTVSCILFHIPRADVHFSKITR